MASPYGHAIIGLSLLNLYYPRLPFTPKKNFGLYGLAALGACLPDLDFVPGIFLGNPSRFHHGISHSLGMAIILSVLASLLMTIYKWFHGFRKLGTRIKGKENKVIGTGNPGTIRGLFILK